MHDVKPLNLLDRGKILSKKAVAISSKVPAHIAERELQYVQKKCQWAGDELQRKTIDAYSPGNMVSLEVKSDGLITEIFVSVCRLGFSAERVAGRCVNDVKRYLKRDAPVAEHLCDQLLLPMVLGNGGVFRTLKPSLHTETNISVIKEMTGCDIQAIQIDEDLYQIEVSK